MNDYSENTLKRNLIYIIRLLLGWEYVLLTDGNFWIQLWHRMIPTEL